MRVPENEFLTFNSETGFEIFYIKIRNIWFQMFLHLELK